MKKTPVGPVLALPLQARRSWSVWALGGLIVLAAVMGVYYWLPGPDVPLPNMTYADPELVQAIDAAAAGVRRSPRSADAWGELGLVLMANSYWNEAAAAFQVAGRRAPADWHWPYYQAVCEQWKRPDLAIVSLRDACRRDAAAEAPRLLLAELLTEAGQFVEARTQFEDVLKSSPDSARALLGLARVLLAQDQLDPSLVAVERAGGHPSSRKSALELKAQIMTRKGNHLAAQEALAGARLLPPDLPWPGEKLSSDLESRRAGKHAALNRVAKLRRAGELEEAQAVVEESERQHRELYWLVEGRLRLQRGDAMGAEEALRQALALDPGSIDALLSLSQAQVQQQDLSGAEQTLSDLLAREPGYGPAWLELGICLRKEDPARAVDALRSAVRNMPRSAAAHAAFAEVLGDQGMAKEAQAHRALAEQLERANQASP